METGIKAQVGAKPRRPAGSGWLLPICLAAGGGGLMALAAGAVRVPVASASPPAGDAPVPELVVTHLAELPSGGEERERLSLFDPTPLFLPGFGGGGMSAGEGLSDRPGGDVGAAFPAALAFPDQRPAADVMRPRLPATPTEAVEFVTGPRWFHGMARSDSTGRTSPTFPAASGGRGRMDVYRAGEAIRVASEVLPPDPALDSAIWRPVELSVLVDAAGMVAAPMVTSGSGTGEVDDRVRTLVSREVLPRLPLRPGIYRLVVGP